MGPSEWRAIGRSVQGSTHLRDQKPNQDAIGWYPDEGYGLPLIVAVADGHGATKYFRSHFGAEFATRTAIDVLREFAEHLPGDGELMMVIDRLPAAIERRWKKAVDDHLVVNPFDEESGATPAPAAIGEDPSRYVAYGTTLLSVLVTDDFVVHLQIGDGDILAVSPTGRVERVIQPDPNLIANQTTSLCLPQARRHFRTQFQKIAGQPPALLMLCSDGYANSFEEDGFLKAGTDYLDLIQTKGIEYVNEHLEQWLSETSQKGSGDDITVGIIAAPGFSKLC
jgi:serine/threonine protein phosphatase PrpC